MMYKKDANMIAIAKEVENAAFALSSLWLAIHREQASIEKKADKLDNLCDYLYSAFVEAENNTEVPQVEMDQWEASFSEYDAEREAWRDYLKELKKLFEICDDFDFRAVCFKEVNAQIAK